ncbi:hypothetical protein N7527_006211 [Penicillium freii]|nr:hypothetical protein N7527_006211 [Penicillium freii]
MLVSYGGALSNYVSSHALDMEKVLREDVPAGDYVIDCKWVFKTKANGTRKARLVIKGYRQKHGVDFHETFAAVSRMDSVRCIVASAATPIRRSHRIFIW